MAINRMTVRTVAYEQHKNFCAGDDCKIGRRLVFLELKVAMLKLSLNYTAGLQVLPTNAGSRSEYIFWFFRSRRASRHRTHTCKISRWIRAHTVSSPFTMGSINIWSVEQWCSRTTSRYRSSSNSDPSLLSDIRNLGLSWCTAPPFLDWVKIDGVQLNQEAMGVTSRQSKSLGPAHYGWATPLGSRKTTEWRSPCHIFPGWLKRRMWPSCLRVCNVHELQACIRALLVQHIRAASCVSRVMRQAISLWSSIDAKTKSMFPWCHAGRKRPAAAAFIQRKRSNLRSHFQCSGLLRFLVYYTVIG